MGVGATRFIDRRVVLEAKRLLADTDVTVAEMRGGVGFDDAVNFSRFFRARAAGSPGTFTAGPVESRTSRTGPHRTG